MKSILIIGLGRFGKHLARQFNEMGDEVLAVDIVEERVNDVLPYVTSAQIGDSTNRTFLESIGARNFDVCIVAIGSDFQNSLETTSLLKEMGCPFVVARAARDVQAKFLARNGADEVLYPERELARWAAMRYSSDHILDYMELGQNHAIFEVPVPDEWVGKTVAELNIRRKFNLNILGQKVGDQLELLTGADSKLQENAHLLVLGSTKDFLQCFKD
ncbi:MAG: TrkA family potassium uptake protein [Peptoniphilaceae bacterium]|nr:TrkA family potassium uptake protein [Peptoniphilaceae bacterium]MDY3075665.1 TrkA family potassium uptake protein [Peptoniphilaceae bacterium]MDY6146256.1 TrkA family potassium uptake protein [Peptoniphilaceae bacterium]